MKAGDFQVFLWTLESQSCIMWAPECLYRVSVKLICLSWVCSGAGGPVVSQPHALQPQVQLSDSCPLRSFSGEPGPCHLPTDSNTQAADAASTTEHPVALGTWHSDIWEAWCYWKYTGEKLMDRCLREGDYIND